MHDTPQSDFLVLGGEFSTQPILCENSESQKCDKNDALLAICRPSGCTVASGVIVVGVVVVVVGVCNRSQMRTSKICMFNFWCEYRP